MKNVFGDDICKVCGSAVKKGVCTYPKCKSHKSIKSNDSIKKKGVK